MDDMQQMMMQAMSGFPMMAQGFSMNQSNEAPSKRKRKGRPIDEECIIDLCNVNRD
jgi:hypothetical protein